MPSKYAVHPERKLIEQSLLDMEGEIVTHLADVACLPRNQRCKDHANYDHPYECDKCAKVLDGVNDMLYDNAGQISKFNQLRKDHNVVTNPKDKADYLSELYDCDDTLHPIPHIWRKLCQSRTFTMLDRKLVGLVHQSDVTRFLAMNPEAPKVVKWIPCRNFHSKSGCCDDNCPYAHTHKRTYSTHMKPSMNVSRALFPQSYCTT